VEGQGAGTRSGEHRGVILLLLLVAAILGLGGFLAVDYIWGLPPMPRVWRWFRRGLIVAALAPFVWWFGAAVKVQRDYDAENAKVQAQAQRNCQIDPEHGSVEACVAVVIGEWSDSFPAPGWFQW